MFSVQGLSSIHYSYQESTSLVKNIDIIEPSFELKHEFKYHMGILKDEKLKFGSKSGLHNTNYRFVAYVISCVYNYCSYIDVIGLLSLKTV